MMTSRSQQYAWPVVSQLLLACCVAVYLKNYWLAEDAYINFRSLDQLWAGRGPVWNVGERVQVYTSALWYWLNAATRLVFRDLYLNTLACSLLLYVLMLVRILREQALLPGIALVLMLLSSNSFMDFTASGLENVLMFFLCASFFYWLAGNEGKPAGALPYLWVAIMLLARHDQLVLFLPVLMGYFFAQWRQQGLRISVRDVLVGMSPFIAWTLFSIIYYGFPFPNTAYAKLSTRIPTAELHAQGVAYLRITAGYDPIIVPVLIAGVLFGFWQKSTRLLTVGMLLNVLYIIHVGGDYMRGRFLAHLYLLALLLVFLGMARFPPKVRNAISIILLLAVAAYTRQVEFTPITTGVRFIDHVKIHETANERGIFYRSTSIAGMAVSEATARPFPDWPFYVDGLKMPNEGRPWNFITNIGMSGYAAGLDFHIFDRLALADPLLARLPAIPGPWAPGHYVREMPWGYAEANLDGVTKIYDADLDEYYRTLRVITRSPDLFTVDRFKAILRANLSPSYGHLRDSHIERWSQRGCKVCKGENAPPAK